MPEDVEKIVAGLTKAQRRMLASSKPLIDARVLVPTYVERKSWPAHLTDTYSVAMKRLTPLGLAVRAHLLSTPNAEKSDVGWPTTGIDAMQALNRLLPNSCEPNRQALESKDHSNAG